jgi:hypothetical protein
MAVRLFLSSGIERVLETADAARLDEPFFIVTRWIRKSVSSRPSSLYEPKTWSPPKC